MSGILFHFITVLVAAVVAVVVVVVVALFLLLLFLLIILILHIYSLGLCPDCLVIVCTVHGLVRNMVTK